MQYAFRIVTRGVNGAVDGESGGVYRERIVGVQLVAGKIDFYQTGRGDFIEQQAIGIDQKLVVDIGNFRRDMGEYQIRPAKVRDQPVTSREINARLPFFRRNFFLYAGDCQCVQVILR